jgi:hypothetical protein
MVMTKAELIASGPTIIQYAVTNSTDGAIWTTAEAAANARDLDQTLAAIAAQKDAYAYLKTRGHDGLGTTNLWAGTDAPATT